MPVHNGRDEKGSYLKWGNRGAKYYYKNGSAASLRNALKKVMKQARAIMMSRYNR
jgi:hypothetical protein